MLRFDKDRWRTLSPMLDHALDLNAEARAAMLADVVRQDPDLAELLRALLIEHDRLADSDFLETALPIGHAPVPSLAGHGVGPYTLEVPLGMGGMGTVWRARRSDGRFEGSVAVKLLNLALLDRQGDQRFKREGTLLARLAHPHIARLLDAGVTSTGQPYLVLEHVDGVRIDRFADERRLSVNKRLELFLQVADAVAHAHANLVVHRDLKPSNILVRPDGEIKLLDFGVGKLVEQETSAQTTLTSGAANALTPECAAPEQARGEPVTTATDVYALGILLYGLLTGRHPTSEGSRTVADHLHALLEGEPVRASNAVSDPTPDDAAARAALRQSTPERLRRLYRGDIDNLLAKALEKNPARRYESVTAFTDDIRRFLNHEPLSVHGQTWSYRTAKFVRRHRWPVAAALVAFGTLSAGLLLANEQRIIAESRFRQLRHLSQQVLGLDLHIRNLAGATEARQALVAASLEYLEGLSRDAGGDPDLLQDVSNGYWQIARIQGVPTGLTLGDFVKAEDSLKKADALLEQILASRPRDRRALERSAVVASDRMILAESERRQADALAHARKAVDRSEALLSQGRPTEAERDVLLGVYGNAATASVNMHRYEDAIGHAKRQLEVARTYGPAPRAESYALTVLANALRFQGDLEGSLQAIRQARDIGQQAAPSADETKRMIERYPLLLREAFILGEDRAISLNRPGEAAALLREAFDMHEAGARRDPKDFTSRTRVASTGRELGDILRWRDPQQAIAVYDVALARLAENRDSLVTRRDRALVLANSSYALRRLNRIADARRRVDDALALLAETKDYPSDRVALDSPVSAVLQAAADQRAHEGHVEEAVQQYERLLEKILAARPDVEHDLRDAYSLSLLYEDLARLYRTTAVSERADGTDAKRRAIWTRWNEARPANPFVRRQLAALER
jgi:serine/threonine-protein kinase